MVVIGPFSGLAKRNISGCCAFEFRKMNCERYWWRLASGSVRLHNALQQKHYARISAAMVLQNKHR